MRPERRILVAGIGNIFLGDDAFGVAVVSRLAQTVWPANVRIVDFGIRGLDLVYALLDGVDAAILVDALPRGEPPGTLCVLEPEWEAPASGSLVSLEAHSMDPVKVLALAASMGARVERLLLVGCEPEWVGSDDDMRMELSPPVAAAVEEAVKMVERLIDQLLEANIAPTRAGASTDCAGTLPA